MSIEFHCFHCNRLLKTDDSKAGMHCECPECQQMIMVPDPAADEADLESGTHSEESFVFDSRKQKAPTISKNSCPQCLSPLNPNAIKCPTCGLLFGKVRTGINTPEYSINANQVFNRTLETFKTHWLISTGGAFLFLFFWFGVRESIGIALSLRPELASFIAIGSLLLQTLLLAGLHILFLNIATDNNPQLNDLISGGRYIFRFLANQFVFAVFIAIGLFLLVVPGILIAVIATPIGYVVVDQNLPGLLSIKRCFEITAGNKWGLFLLILVALGMAFWGLLAFVVGMIIAFPLMNLLFAVAYCEMTGQ